MLWNGPQYHLLVNHVAVVAMPIALAIFSVGWRLKNEAIENTGLAVFVFCGLGAFASDQTGDLAADFVKNLPDFQKELIRAHSDAADYALILSCIAGGIATLLLIMRWKKLQKFSRALKLLLVLISLMAGAALARTAHLGGLIRHSEIRLSQSVSALQTTLTLRRSGMPRLSASLSLPRMTSVIFPFKV